MIKLGLTGSIGAGKTTTAKMFEACGAAIFDADLAVHKLYDKGGKAVKIIGAGIPQAVREGRVDRKILSAELMKDPLLFEVLESFIHPLVGEQRDQAEAEARAKGVKVFVNDVPLLFETGGHEEMDITVLVLASDDVQRRRVLSRPNMTPEKFEAIMARQMKNAQKKQLADYIIYTDRGMDFARKQVQKIMSELTA